MDSYQVGANVLIITGIVGLICSLFPATRIIKEVRASKVRWLWKTLRLLIVVFILGYTSYVLIAMHGIDLENLVVAVVFFFGSLFVLFVCLITLNTVQDLKQLHILQIENITDELTGIYNRRHLERCLDKEIARAKRFKSPLSILMLDLDHYKAINDLHGHLIGDQVLRCISDHIKKITRRMDTVARYGGDEIVVLLPTTEESIAWSIADQIRLSIEKDSPIVQRESCECKDVYCTVSIGVASMAGNYVTGHQLLKMADTALYHAKNSGRNCVVSFKPGMSAISKRGV